MAKKSKKSKKKSMSYWFWHAETGHHYTIRLGRDAADLLKNETIKRYNPILKKHVDYKLKKTKK